MARSACSHSADTPRYCPHVNQRLNHWNVASGKAAEQGADDPQTIPEPFVDLTSIVGAAIVGLATFFPWMELLYAPSANKADPLILVTGTSTYLGMTILIAALITVALLTLRRKSRGVFIPASILLALMLWIWYGNISARVGLNALERELQIANPAPIASVGSGFYAAILGAAIMLAAALGAILKVVRARLI